MSKEGRKSMENEYGPHNDKNPVAQFVDAGIAIIIKKMDEKATLQDVEKNLDGSFLQSLAALDDVRNHILNEAWYALSVTKRQELCEAIASGFVKQVRSNKIEGLIQQTINKLIYDSVVDEIKKRRPEIQARVEREVSERWEREVKTLVTARLKECLAEVKRKFSVP